MAEPDYNAELRFGCVKIAQKMIPTSTSPKQITTIADLLYKYVKLQQIPERDR